MIDINNPFIADIAQVSEIQGVKMILYKGKYCMVRKLNNDSNLLLINKNKPYLIRYTPGKPMEPFTSIRYIPISEEKYKLGLKKYKNEHKTVKGDNKHTKSKTKTLKKKLKMF